MWTEIFHRVQNIESDVSNRLLSKVFGRKNADRNFSDLPSLASERTFRLLSSAPSVLLVYAENSTFHPLLCVEVRLFAPILILPSGRDRVRVLSYALDQELKCDRNHRDWQNKLLSICK